MADNYFPRFFDPNLDERKRRELDLMSSLAPLGAEEEEIAFMKNEAKRLRETDQPKGRQAGQVYVAANPLEHAAWGLNQYNARYNQNTGESRRRKLGTDTQTIVDQWMRRQSSPTIDEFTGFGGQYYD